MRINIIIYRRECLDKIASLLASSILPKGSHDFSLYFSQSTCDELTWNKLIESSKLKNISGITRHFYDDSYLLDFGGYLSAIKERKQDSGAIYLNDTFFTKHFSPYLMQQLISRAQMLSDSDGVHFVGPYRHSEYFSHKAPNEFIATYCFYLSSAAEIQLQGSDRHLDVFMEENAGLIAVYRQHLRALNYPSALHEPKLRAFSMERIFFDVVVKSGGGVWFIEFGFKCKARALISRMLNRINPVIFSLGKI